MPNSLYIEANHQNNENLLNNLGDLPQPFNDNCKTAEGNIYQSIEADVDFILTSLAIKHSLILNFDHTYAILNPSPCPVKNIVTGNINNQNGVINEIEITANSF